MHEDAAEDKKTKILCVGMACVDFINVVKEFPKEDSDQRILNYYWQRGGNASNNCTVLSLLSVPCEFMGVLGTQGAEAEWIKSDFQDLRIDISHCEVKDVHCPVATVILNQASGTRTILFYPRDRPELSHENFQRSFCSDFSPYFWIHFGICSNVSDISSMIDDIIQYKSDKKHRRALNELKSEPIVSVEVEKPELTDAEIVMKKADIVFISKDYASSKGYFDPIRAVKELYQTCRHNAVLVCPWGEKGAAAYLNHSIVTSPALSDITVIDSLGAGDTFVAGFMARLWKNNFTIASQDSKNDSETLGVIKDALDFSCALAGQKCSMFGYTGLKSYK
ncbi:unnamed protein product [Lymnaea stagnalis]|uniref:Carbohydrate kinase PfkB domain-containing protein n=1 Tax=Lymnaea stagnalis TaxID=6523 RepID=A0AAV2HRP8_LYMST